MDGRRNSAPAVASSFPTACVLRSRLIHKKVYNLRNDNFISFLFGDRLNLCGSGKNITGSSRTFYGNAHPSHAFHYTRFHHKHSLPEPFESEFHTSCPFIPK